jgi:hypothetical protein
MNQPKKRIGRPPLASGPRQRRVFAVSPEHAAWLDTLPNRSAWLAEQIENSRKLISETAPANE